MQTSEPNSSTGREQRPESKCRPMIDETKSLCPLRLTALIFLILHQITSSSCLSAGAYKQTKGSEWNFDNQALRSISSQHLCSHYDNRTAGSGQQVNVVTFTGNRISSIEPNAFECVASELRILVLTSNEIAHIPRGAFEALHSVQVLLLDNNLLTSIPSEDSLSPLRSLRHLNLADNRIEQLDSWSFGAHLSGLISLNLAGNPLVRVHPSSLIHLIKLKTLILKSNAIETVPQFEHCQSLLLLDLSYNYIRGSLSENFTQHPNLIDLYLGNNQLESITDRALIGLNKLKVLELQNNKLKYIQASAFLPVQLSLEELNLSHNLQLSQLTSSGLERVKSLKCYGNNQLRELPHFKSASHLALTYAYHCCDYPWSSESHLNGPTNKVEPAHSVGAGASSLLDRSHQHPAGVVWDFSTEEGHSSREIDLTSELILWPPTGGSKRQPRNTMMDEQDEEHQDELLILDEMNRIRAKHFIWAKLKWPRLIGRNVASNRSKREDEAKRPLAVRCLPNPSPFLPCKDLFDSWLLRLGIWLVFLLAFLGNGLVIIVLSSVRQTSSSSALTSIMWLAHSKRHIDVPRFLVINLAIADLLMALYLGLLAFVDLSTLGEFKLYAIRWQYSSGCKLAGFLAVLSSELSVFILAIITLERNYAITNAVHLNRRLSLQKAMLIMFLGYAFALAMAVMPLYGVSDYRRFSICLPLDVDSNLSSQIYVITLISINTFSFVLLMGCYLRMYFAIRGSQAWNANDLRIAKRMSILVLTDFLCWMPIIASGLASLFGYHLIGTEGMKIMTIFILPLNSVANPFLYAITTKKFKRDLSTLRRRALALLRLNGTKSANHDAHAIVQHHNHLPGDHRHQDSSKFHYHTTAYHNNGLRQNHHRHEVLLTCHQHKGGGGGRRAGKAQASARMRLVSQQQQQQQLSQTSGRKLATIRAPPELLVTDTVGKRAAVIPLINQQTCITCSCHQQRFNVDQQPAGHQQQPPVRPCIVLETATQTSDQHRAYPQAALLLKKSRSISSGMTLMALPCHDDETRYNKREGNKRIAAAVDQVLAKGCLTKLEESMVASGDDVSLSWNRHQLPGSTDSNDDQQPAKVSPLSLAASNSPSIGRQRPELATSRAHLSVEPLQWAAHLGGADIRSVSACGQLASCRAIESGETLTRTTLTAYKCQQSSNNKRPVGGSCDTVQVTAGSGSGGGGGGGSAIKLSRSIQRLLFGPLAKAWSSIQISLNSNIGPHLNHQQQQQAHMDQEANLLNQASDMSFATHNDANFDNCDPNESPAEPNCGYMDDILMMGSPIRRSLRIGERRMSRSCDAIQPKFHDEQLNSLSLSTEQSSSFCEYDDDQRVLLATINRLAAGNNRTRLLTANDYHKAAPSSRQTPNNTVSNPLRVKARCTRCRSWSPALLTKLENCIYQMKSKISSGFVGSQQNGPSRLDSAKCDDRCEQSTCRISSRQSPSALARLNLIGDEEQEMRASSESEAELEDDVEYGQTNLKRAQEGDDVSLEDQSGEPVQDWVFRRHSHSQKASSRMQAKKSKARFRQQSSVNSDTLSTRTAGTLVTNISLSSDSNASIQLAATTCVVTNHQPTRLGIIADTDTPDDDDI